MPRKSIFSVVLSGVYFITNVAVLHSAEKSFWEERRRSTHRQKDSSLMLAGLPTGGRSNVQSFLTQMPSLTTNAMTPALEANVARNLPKGFVEKHKTMLSALPFAHGSIRKITLPAGSTKSNRVVVHIQDVHHSEDAQKNIGQAIQSLAAKDQAPLIALEGAFSPIKLSGLRGFSRQDVLKKLSDYLLRTHKISGPIHAALTGPKEFNYIVGIDDPALYNANVEAYRRSAPMVKDTKNKLQKIRKDLNDQKAKTFNEPLLDFDRKVLSYHDGKTSLGDHVKTLAAHSSEMELSVSIKQFLNATHMESSLNFKEVESQRAQLVETLVKTLEKSETDALIQQSMAYRAGQLRYADFYQSLKNLCERNGVTLTKFPAMADYVKYVLAADRIEPERLMEDMADLEKTAYVRLAKSAEEIALITQSRRLTLASKLVDFALIPEEYMEYAKTDMSGLGVPELTTFDGFYKEAQARDVAMTDNLLRAMDEQKTKTAVLVTGGYHAGGMAERLKKAGVAVIAFTPKIQKLDATQGSGYLSVFTQEKTPLEQMFQGRTLFLASNPTEALPTVAPLLAAGVVAATPGVLDAASQEAKLPDLKADVEEVLNELRKLGTLPEGITAPEVDVRQTEEGRFEVTVKIKDEEYNGGVRTVNYTVVFDREGNYYKVVSALEGSTGLQYFLNRYLSIMKLKNQLTAMFKSMSKNFNAAISEFPVLKEIRTFDLSDMLWFLDLHKRKHLSLAETVARIVKLETLRALSLHAHAGRFTIDAARFLERLGAPLPLMQHISPVHLAEIIAHYVLNTNLDGFPRVGRLATDSSKKRGKKKPSSAATTESWWTELKNQMDALTPSREFPVTGAEPTDALPPSQDFPGPEVESEELPVFIKPEKWLIVDPSAFRSITREFSRDPSSFGSFRLESGLIEYVSPENLVVRLPELKRQGFTAVNIVYTGHSITAEKAFEFARSVFDLSPSLYMHDFYQSPTALLSTLNSPDFAINELIDGLAHKRNFFIRVGDFGGRELWSKYLKALRAWDDAFGRYFPWEELVIDDQSPQAGGLPASRIKDTIAPVGARSEALGIDSASELSKKATKWIAKEIIDRQFIDYFDELPIEDPSEWRLYNEFVSIIEKDIDYWKNFDGFEANRKPMAFEKFVELASTIDLDVKKTRFLGNIFELLFDDQVASLFFKAFGEYAQSDAFGTKDWDHLIRISEQAFDIAGAISEVTQEDESTYTSFATILFLILTSLKPGQQNLFKDLGIDLTEEIESGSYATSLIALLNQLDFSPGEAFVDDGRALNDIKVLLSVPGVKNEIKKLGMDIYQTHGNPEGILIDLVLDPGNAKAIIARNLRVYEERGDHDLSKKEEHVRRSALKELREKGFTVELKTRVREFLEWARRPDSDAWTKSIEVGPLVGLCLRVGNVALMEKMADAMLKQKSVDTRIKLLQVLNQHSDVIANHPTIIDDLLLPIISINNPQADKIVEVLCRIIETAERRQPEVIPPAQGTQVIQWATPVFTQLKNFVQQRGVIALDILENLVLPGVSSGQFELSDMALMEVFNKDVGVRLWEAFLDYKKIRSEPLSPADRRKKINALSDLYAKMQSAVMDGSAPPEILLHPAFPAILMKVYPPSLTRSQRDYLQLINKSRDRTFDLYAHWATSEAFDMKHTIGAMTYVWVDDSKPADPKAWESYTNWAAAGSELPTDITLAHFGEDLMRAWSQGNITKLKKHFFQSSSLILKAQGLTFPNVLGKPADYVEAYEYLADTLRQLIESAVLTFASENPDAFARLGKERFAGQNKSAAIVGFILSLRRNQKTSRDIELGLLSKFKNLLSPEQFRILASLETETEMQTFLNATEINSPPDRSKVIQSVYGDLFGQDAATMQRELYGDRTQQKKIERRVVDTGEKRIIRTVLSKRHLHSVSGFVEGICTAKDPTIWESANTFRLILFDDEKNVSLGGVILLVRREKGKKYLSLPGINPSEAFLKESDPQAVLNAIMTHVYKLAEAGGFDGVEIPSRQELFSNRAAIVQLVQSAGFEVKEGLTETVLSKEPPYTFTSVYDVPLGYQFRSNLSRNTWFSSDVFGYGLLIATSFVLSLALGVDFTQFLDPIKAAALGLGLVLAAPLSMVTTSTLGVAAVWESRLRRKDPKAWALKHGVKEGSPEFTAYLAAAERIAQAGRDAAAAGRSAFWAEVREHNRLNREYIKRLVNLLTPSPKPQGHDNNKSEYKGKNEHSGEFMEQEFVMAKQDFSPEVWLVVDADAFNEVKKSALRSSNGFLRLRVLKGGLVRLIKSEDLIKELRSLQRSGHKKVHVVLAQPNVQLLMNLLSADSRDELPTVDVGSIMEDGERIFEGLASPDTAIINALKTDPNNRKRLVAVDMGNGFWELYEAAFRDWIDRRLGGNPNSKIIMALFGLNNLGSVLDLPAGQGDRPDTRPTSISIHRNTWLSSDVLGYGLFVGIAAALAGVFGINIAELSTPIQSLLLAFAAPLSMVTTSTLGVAAVWESRLRRKDPKAWALKHGGKEGSPEFTAHMAAAERIAQAGRDAAAAGRSAYWAEVREHNRLNRNYFQALRVKLHAVGAKIVGMFLPMAVVEATLQRAERKAREHQRETIWEIINTFKEGLSSELFLVNPIAEVRAVFPIIVSEGQGYMVELARDKTPLANVVVLLDAEGKNPRLFVRIFGDDVKRDQPNPREYSRSIPYVELDPSIMGTGGGEATNRLVSEIIHAVRINKFPSNDKKDFLDSLQERAARTMGSETGLDRDLSLLFSPKASDIVRAAKSDKTGVFKGLLSYALRHGVLEEFNVNPGQVFIQNATIIEPCGGYFSPLSKQMAVVDFNGTSIYAHEFMHFLFDNWENRPGVATSQAAIRAVGEHFTEESHYALLLSFLSLKLYSINKVTWLNGNKTPGLNEALAHLISVVTGDIRTAHVPIQKPDGLLKPPKFEGIKVQATLADVALLRQLRLISWFTAWKLKWRISREQAETLPLNRLPFKEALEIQNPVDFYNGFYGLQREQERLNRAREIKLIKSLKEWAWGQKGLGDLARDPLLRNVQTVFPMFDERVFSRLEKSLIQITIHPVLNFPVSPWVRFMRLFPASYFVYWLGIANTIARINKPLPRWLFVGLVLALTPSLALAQAVIVVPTAIFGVALLLSVAVGVTGFALVRNLLKRGDFKGMQARDALVVRNIIAFDGQPAAEVINELLMSKPVNLGVGTGNLLLSTDPERAAYLFNVSKDFINDASYRRSFMQNLAIPKQNLTVRGIVDSFLTFFTQTGAATPAEAVSSFVDSAAQTKKVPVFQAVIRNAEDVEALEMALAELAGRKDRNTHVVITPANKDMQPRVSELQSKYGDFHRNIHLRPVTPVIDQENIIDLLPLHTDLTEWAKSAGVEFANILVMLALPKGVVPSPHGLSDLPDDSPLKNAIVVLLDTLRAIPLQIENWDHLTRMAALIAQQA